MAERAIVHLVSLPFYSAFASCYQIELLAGILRERGYDARPIHANYEFGMLMEEQGELRLYKKLTSIRYFGDYLYLARRYPERGAEIFAEMQRTIAESNNYSLAQYKSFYRVINHIHASIVARVEAERPAVVGLSATHYQLVPSLLLAHQIKARCPEVRIVLGGYLSSLATAHDLLRMHADIDWIVYGEGEIVLPDLLDELVGRTRSAGADGPAPATRGVREGVRQTATPTPPRYDDFILGGPARKGHTRYVAFNFELSRGCYWDKCNFCNFNATYGHFRKFDSEPVVAELDRLNRQYGAFRFQFLDTSLPPRFADYLARERIVRPEYDIFCELMIDFDRRRLAALRDFGVRRVQVGIESFSTAHLRAMTKNADLLDNVRFLQDCRALAIEPVYGLMVNVPNETLAHLEEMLAHMRLFRHLPPPKYLSDFDARPESPAFRERARYGCTVAFQPGIFDEVLPAADHNCELRPSHVDFGLEGGEERRRLLAAIAHEMEVWRAAWQRGSTPPRLVLELEGAQARIIDERSGAPVDEPIGAAEAELLRRAAERQRREQALAGLPLAPAELERLRERGWLLVEGDELLGLVSVPEREPATAIVDSEPTMALVQLRTGAMRA